MTTKTYVINVTRNSDSLTPSTNYTATFDNYDGAPIDHETPSQDPIGHGIDHYCAMEELLDNACEKGLLD